MTIEYTEHQLALVFHVLLFQQLTSLCFNTFLILSRFPDLNALLLRLKFHKVTIYIYNTRKFYSTSFAVRNELNNICWRNIFDDGLHVTIYVGLLPMFI